MRRFKPRRAKPSVPKDAVYMINVDLSTDATVSTSMASNPGFPGKDCGFKRWSRLNRVDVWSRISHQHARSYYFRAKSEILEAEPPADPNRRKSLFGDD